MKCLCARKKCDNKIKKSPYCVGEKLDLKSRSCLGTLLIVVVLTFGTFFIGSEVISYQYKQTLSTWPVTDTIQTFAKLQVIDTIQNSKSENNPCKNAHRPPGSEALPRGIAAETSDLEMRPLWNYSGENNNRKALKSLLAMAVGIKQKETVNKIVEKFLASDFVVMLFHYDGLVDDWKDLAWNDRAIHVSALHQTKWWFAKRFLHPDIVAEYDYIFLWDEDLIVDNFDPTKYLLVVKDEGLEISQPALDPGRSEVHHQITIRVKNSKAHRRIYRTTGGCRCDGDSTEPPCTGWVEMMAPVFSRKAWRCTWYMIQNDLIHAWGLDMKLGYCAQGDRMKTVGVVDSEYVVHQGVPTLGGSHKDKASQASQPQVDVRMEVRRRSVAEMVMFNRRWRQAAIQDKCWIDPYGKSPSNRRSH